jgi:molybdopterin-guanine dinucleotide biosynthesis protein A
VTVVGVLLAGGRSERMGGEDKSLIALGGKPLIAHAAARLRPQVDRLVVNANGDAARFAFLELPVVPDADGGTSGPLAGILAGIDWTLANAPDVSWIATVAVDTPFIPFDLVATFLAASSDAGTIRLAASNGRLHQVIGLWPAALRNNLAAWLQSGRSNAVRDFLATQPHTAVDFDTRAGLEPFFNINTPEDLERARGMLIDTGP